MSEQIKPTITYMKNGKKVTKVLQWYNTNMILNSIFTYKNRSYQVMKDIDWIHFKDCELFDLFAITGPQNGECIFENCTFKRNKDSLGADYLLLSGGKIQLLNPKLENLDSIVVHKGEEVEIQFDKAPFKKVDTLHVMDTKKVKIVNHHAIDNLDVDANVVMLEKDFVVKRFSVKGNQVSIVGHSDEPITIATKSVPTIVADQKLVLKNCKIGNRDHAACLKFSKIDLDNLIMDTKQLTVVQITDSRVASGRMKNYEMKSGQRYSTTEDFLEFLSDSRNEIKSKTTEGNFNYKNNSDRTREDSWEKDTSMIESDLNEGLEELHVSAKKR